MKKVKYGLIGFGEISQTRIAPEGFCLDRSRFEPHPEANLLAVTSRSPQRQQEVEALGLTWFESIEALLADPDIQAVFIATNNLNHAPIGRQTLMAGKHCLLEKPATTTLEDIRQLRRIAADKDLSLSVNHMMSCNSYNRRARDLVAEGAIGQVNDICLHMEFLYGATEKEAASWLCAVPEELGGPIGDVGSHCLYMTEFLMNSIIESVSCTYLPRTQDVAVENGAFIQCCLSNGTQATIRVAINQPRGGEQGTLENLGYEIYGTKGVLRGYATLFQLSGHADEIVPVRLELDTFGRVQEIKIPKVDNIYAEMIRQHALSIKNKNPLNGLDAEHNLTLILACHRSAQAGSEEIRLEQ